jgi:hypothetical protein
MDKEVTLTSQGGGYLLSFIGRRKRLALDDMNRVAKRLSSENRVDTNDVAAVDALVQNWRSQGDTGPLLHYQPQAVALCPQYA